jgi:hypothetical protein
MVARQGAGHDGAGWLLYDAAPGRDPEKTADPDFGFSNRRILGTAETEADLHAAAAAAAGRVDATLKLML